MKKDMRELSQREIPTAAVSNRHGLRSHCITMAFEEGARGDDEKDYKDDNYNDGDKDDDNDDPETLRLLRLLHYHNDNTFHSEHNGNDQVLCEERKTDFICFACHSPYKHPRTLPCLHTFCSRCIAGFQTYPASCANPDRGGNEPDWPISSESESESRANHVSNISTHLGLSQSLDRNRERRASTISSESRVSLDSRKSDSLDDPSHLFRGRSKHAKVIENCIRRSHSHGDNSFGRHRSVGDTRSRSSSANTLTRTPFRQSANYRRNGHYNTLMPDPSTRHDSTHSRFTSNERAFKTRASNEDGQYRIIICPICLKEISVTSSLENLPRNYMIERLVSRDISNQIMAMATCTLCLASARKKGGEFRDKRDVESDFQDSHFENDVKYTATIRCEDCEINMCSHCAALHRMRKKTKRHKIASLDLPMASKGVGQSVSSDDHYVSSFSLRSGSASFRSLANTHSDSSVRDKNTKHNKLNTSRTKTASQDQRSYVNLSELSISNRPGLLKSIRKLKLPNLHRFHKLFGFSSDTQNRTQSSSSSRNKCDKGKHSNGKSNAEGHGRCRYDDHNDPHLLALKTGLVNGGFDDRVTRQHRAGVEDGIDTTLQTDARQGGGTRIRRRPRPVSDSAALIRRGKPANKPMTCSRHPNEELHMFCLQCRVCLCRQCVVERHSHHRYELMTRHLFKSQIEEMDDLVQEVLPAMERVDKQMTSLGQIEAKAKDISSKVTQEVNDFMDLYVEAIQKQRKVLVSQIEDHLENRKRLIGVARVHLLHMRSEVERTCQFVSDLVTGASDWEILGMKGLITDRLKDLQATEVTLPHGLDSDLRFVPSDKGEVINKFQMFGRVIADNLPCPSRSFCSVEGLDNAKMFSPCTTAVTVCDKEGVVIKDGCDVTIKAWIISQENSARNVLAYLSNSIDGVRTVTFTPMDKGSHFLHVTLQGCAIRGSPYKFYVKRRARRHTGQFYCCSHCYTEVKGQRTGACGCGSTGKVGSPGCYHGNTDHPGCPHWSCCGLTSQQSQCTLVPRSNGQARRCPRSAVRQITL